MNETEQLLLAQREAQAREALLSENDLFIRRCASKAARRFVDCHDDAYSEALIAFNDAITAYRPDKGSFQAFAAAAIQNRVTDLLRRESRNAKCVPFSALGTQDDHGDEVPFEIEDPVPMVSDAALEISALRQELDKFNISFFDLPKSSPKFGRTKRASSLRVDESAIRAAIALYTRESGVRSLERQLGKICRKAAMQLATSDVKRVTVTEKNIKDFLGAPRAAQEKIPEKDLVGVVNGLAWTEVGGEILPVEVGVMDGSGKVELTGNLGDVMQESCRAALSCLRQRAQELGIAPDFYKTKDVHIHFPEGAIPKDGPSAGIAIATAVLSALTGQAVHRDVAMTGEITLRGRVLAIGGLREKTMGALRAGVHTVILPKENEKDLDEIDPLVREKLRFVPVETVDAVFAEALVLPEKCTAAAHESYLPPVQESAHSALRAGEMS